MPASGAPPFLVSVSNLGPARHVISSSKKPESPPPTAKTGPVVCSNIDPAQPLIPVFVDVKVVLNLLISPPESMTPSSSPPSG